MDPTHSWTHPLVSSDGSLTWIPTISDSGTICCRPAVIDAIPLRSITSCGPVIVTTAPYPS